jgi:hypothetical protein
MLLSKRQPHTPQRMEVTVSRRKRSTLDTTMRRPLTQSERFPVWPLTAVSANSLCPYARGANTSVTNLYARLGAVQLPRLGFQKRRPLTTTNFARLPRLVPRWISEYSRVTIRNLLAKKSFHLIQHFITSQVQQTRNALPGVSAGAHDHRAQKQLHIKQCDEGKTSGS